jgi:hypothetical protein
LNGLSDMGRSADRIAHVVQSIEYGHKSVVATWKVFRRGDAEMDVRETLFLSVAIRCLDGSGVQIKSMEFRFRECLRHEEGGYSMTASDVRDTSPGGQFLLYAVKRGYPVLVYVGLITGPKKTLCPAEKAGVMLSPWHTRSSPKTLGDKRFIVVDGRDAVETSRHRCGTIRISKHCRLFSREKKSLACSLVAYVSRSGLGTEPFAQVPLI